jgi:hypothetical protein
MDIGALRSLLRASLDTIDYTNLDDHPAFPGRTSTTERVAEHIASEVARAVMALLGGWRRRARSQMTGARHRRRALLRARGARHELPARSPP